MRLCRFKGAKIQKNPIRMEVFSKNDHYPNSSRPTSGGSGKYQCIMTKKRVIGIGEMVLGNNISDDLVAAFRAKKGTKKGL